MKPLQSTIRARFDGKEFAVIEQGPELPPTFDPLLHYLNTLSSDGWRAVKGKFESWDLTLWVEKDPAAANSTVTSYLIPVLHQNPSPGGTAATGAQHKLLMDTLNKAGVKEGWQVLAGPKQFSIRSEVWTISIWAKSFVKK